MALAGCSATGPSASNLAADASQPSSDEFGYSIVDIDEQSLPILLSSKPKRFSTVFGNKSWRPANRIGVGDIVSIVVWEPSEQGLFANSATGNKAELGPFQIESNGQIPIPYVGYVTAKGRTVSELRWAVQSQLKDKAIDPQVVVTIQENSSNQVAVNGSVRNPGRIPISVRGDRILDVVAKSGGASEAASETQLTLVRGSTRQTQLLKNILEIPGENVFVRTDDQIYLTHDPYTFTAFGAVPKVGEYPIDVGDASLIEAVAKIGGLDDNRANPEGLFVFRYEDTETLRQLGAVDPDYLPSKAPVIYRLNMLKGKSYFLGQSFEVQDKDIIYVANSLGTEFRKFLGILNGVTAVANRIDDF